MLKGNVWLGIKQNICLVDGSWRHDTPFCEYGWVWKMMNGRTQLLGSKNQCIRLSPFHSEVETLMGYAEYD